MSFQGSVLNAQVTLENAIRARLAKRQEIRTVEVKGASPEFHRLCDEHKEACLFQVKALRALEIALAADMGVEP